MSGQTCGVKIWLTFWFLFWLPVVFLLGADASRDTLDGTMRKGTGKGIIGCIILLPGIFATGYGTGCLVTGRFRRSPASRAIGG
jgi:hypothetical protein